MVSVFLFLTSLTLYDPHSLFNLPAPSLSHFAIPSVVLSFDVILSFCHLFHVPQDPSHPYHPPAPLSPHAFSIIGEPVAAELLDGFNKVLDSHKIFGNIFDIRLVTCYHISFN